jgi:hypothetical protein
MPNRPLRILILSNYYQYVTNANVIGDFLFSFKTYSQNAYYYILKCHDLTPKTDFSAFDVIVLFWDIYLLGNSLRQAVIENIYKASALKVLFLQDEYRDVWKINDIMARLGINIMCTCVAEQDHEHFYPRSRIPSLQATYTVLTGYVPPKLASIPPDPNAPRHLDIAYRSRNLPYWLGDLAREKQIIAERFQEISERNGLRSDISVNEWKRIYGEHWITFLRSARLSLGTGSGASVIDFSSEIRRNCEAYLANHPDATYDEVKGRFFADVDGKIVINTISPRFFETTACGSALILHEDPYGGILNPDRHYILVKKDYSNIDEVILKIKDAEYCRQLASNAYADLIASRKYSYETFVGWFDTMLKQHVGTHATGFYITPREFEAQQKTAIRNGKVIEYVFTPLGRINIVPIRLVWRSLWMLILRTISWSPNIRRRVKNLLRRA